MTEAKGFELLNTFNTCWACLRTAEDVSPMSFGEISMYKSLVRKAESSNIMMYICIYCRWIFKKIVKLRKHCQTAYDVLHDGVKMDTKTLILQPLYKFDTMSELHYVGPDDKYDVNDDVSDDNDVDELPLIMLSSESRGSKEKERKKDKTKTETDPEIKEEVEIKEEFPIDTQSTKNQKRKKLEKSQDGFTSRMVRETNEYIVIKLTKEQVVQEMQQKSTSEAYLRAPYKCADCVKPFNFHDVLLAHREKHSPEHGSFLCDICSQYCPSAVSLRGHMKSHTTRYKCKICGYVRLSRQHVLEHHSVAHCGDKQTYACDACAFTTNKRTVIQRHVKTHSSERHACHHCGKLFKTINTLRVHTLRHQPRPHRCPQCEQTFLSPAALRTHARAHHTTHTGDYYCVECDVRFKSPETLKHHFRRAKRHRDPSSYKHSCSVCGSRHPTPAALRAHSHGAHGAGSAHACAHCTRTYSSRDTLRAHVWRTHTHAHASPPACTVCGNTFSRTTSLKAHMRTHARGKTHVCTCGATFTHPATLRAHRAEKHPHKDEIPNESRAPENPSLEI